MILLFPRTVVRLSSVIIYDWSPWTSTSSTWVHGMNTQKWNVDGSLDLYCYATGAVPTEANFEKKGGYVYIFGTYNGHFHRSYSTPRNFEQPGREGSSTLAYWFVDYIESNLKNFGNYGGPAMLEPYTQLPASPASHTGSTYHCKVALSFFTRKIYLLPLSRRILLQTVFHVIQGQRRHAIHFRSILRGIV